MSKISQYSALTSTQPDDVLPVVDVHDTSMASTGTTKKITVANLLATTDAAGAAAAAQAASLQKTSNLSDLADAATARTNLGVPAIAGDLGGTSAAPQVTGTHLASPLPVAQGGTSGGTQQAAINALTGTQTSGRYLRSDGANATLAAIQAADVPTLNQNTTGTAGNVTGTVAIANGGTGQVTQQAALDALAGAVTGSQVLAGNGTHVTLRALAAADLPAGTTSAQGALQLDGNAADIAALAGSGAAGATGKAADAAHVHPNTGLVTSVTAADSSVTVAGTAQAPTVASVAAQYTQRIFAV